MKADAGAGRISAIRSMFPIHDDAGGRNKSAGRLDHARPSSAERGMKKNGESSRLKLIVAIEQWICLVLGFVCIASGIWGIFLKLSQTYGLTLRATAVACLVMGLVLVRRGWVASL
jgi:hypothetical protein